MLSFLAFPNPEGKEKNFVSMLSCPFPQGIEPRIDSVILAGASFGLRFNSVLRLV